jgi:uncharacterized protein YggE
MAIAVLVAYVVGSSQAASSGAQAAGDSSTGDVANIMMTGTGEATGVPDQLTFDLAVSTSGSDVSSALHRASSTTRHVLQAVQAQKVARKDLQTTGLSISPVYDYSGSGPAVITGYSVTENVSVLVRSLPSAGRTITAAVQAGGNAVRLHGVRLQIGDEDALLKQARDDAIADARTKAEQYAAAAGRGLGDVTSIREVQGSGRVIVPATFRASADAAVTGGSVPIRAGSAHLHVTVKVIWSFS